MKSLLSKTWIVWILSKVAALTYVCTDKMKKQQYNFSKLIKNQMSLPVIPPFSLKVIPNKLYNYTQKLFGPILD
jgi:hypothetical protein